ncbi:MAG: HAD family phosphatase [Erysipelotrichaceae bacterium]
MLKSVIFDFDGVVIDTEIIYLESVKEYLSTLGIQTTIQDIQYIVGMKMDAITKDLKKQFNLINYSLDELILGQRKVFNQKMESNEITLMTGLLNFLNELRSRNIKCILASSSSRIYLCQLLSRFKIDEYFDRIISGEEVKKSKPNPDIFLKAIEESGIEKKDTIIIEDSINGIRAGIRAGITVFGFKGSLLWQNTSEANFEVSNFRELSEILFE